MNLFGTVTTAGLSGITTSDDGTVVINGELDNTGATLDVGTGSALGTPGFGTILGGTVHDTGSGLLTSGRHAGRSDVSGRADAGGQWAVPVCRGRADAGDGSNGSQPGGIDLSGAVNSAIWLLGSETLNNATLKLRREQRE